MRPYVSINPTTEAKLQEYPFTSKTQAELMLEKGKLAYHQWRNLGFNERAEPILKLADLLKSNADDLAKMVSMEMGKLFAHAKAEILKSATLCEYYARHSEELLQPEMTQVDESHEVSICYEPMGIVLGIFPWNFPYWQILRSAVPILMSGNGILVKPAPNVPQCSLALQNLIDQSGFPSGIYQTIFADEKLVSELIADDRIAGTTLTGSEAAGSAVAAQSGKHIKHSVLELGGSDPLIVLNDAKLDETIQQAVFARFQNNGQSCVAAKRFLVQREIAELFTQKLIAESEKLILGDPQLAETQIGPLARKDLLELLTNQVNDTVQSGANILFQSSQKTSRGFFYPPTILTNIPKGSRAYQEELFGPVIGLYLFDTDKEAIALANDTKFGLGASIYSTDLSRAKRMASKIESGMVYINQIVKSDVRFPFGGIKKSGYGREIGSFGLKSFCNVKSVWVKG
ncbi:MAG: NAD-dependent succinate-semialdehyde dehydrogenase [Bacteroidota bacterium]|nr:NAD-dependent succinate-semialdehyde dehydrogenase [Bacteroidota bacterium]